MPTLHFVKIDFQKAQGCFVGIGKKTVWSIIIVNSSKNNCK